MFVVPIQSDSSILDSLIDVAFGCPLGALHEENRALV